MPSVTPGLEGSSSERTLAAESKSCPDDEGSHFVARDGNVTSEISQRESPDTDSDPFPPTNEYSPSQREAIEARIHAKYGTRKSMTESQLYLDCDPAVDQIARETRPPAGPGRTAAWVASLRNEGLDEDDPLVSNASVTSANDIQIPKCEHLQILKRELIEVKVKETKLKMDIAALEKEIKAERGLKVVQQMIPKTRLCQKLQATTAEQRDPKIRESKESANLITDDNDQGDGPSRSWRKRLLDESHSESKQIEQRKRLRRVTSYQKDHLYLMD